MYGACLILQTIYISQMLLQPVPPHILFTKILENQGYHQDFRGSGSSFIPPANYSFTEDSCCLCEILEFQNTHLVHGFEVENSVSKGRSSTPTL